MLTKAIAQTEKLLNQLDRRAVLQRQEDAAALVKRWELADHTGEKRPHVESVELKFKPRPYTTAQSTIDAFWCVVGLDDPTVSRPGSTITRETFRHYSSFWKPSDADTPRAE